MHVRDRLPIVVQVENAPDHLTPARESPARVVWRVHQQTFQSIKAAGRIALGNFQTFLHNFVEVFQQRLAFIQHRVADFSRQIELELLEGGMNFVGVAAILVDVGNAALKIDTGFHGAEHFVAGTEHAIEELELLVEQFIDAAIRLIITVEEVNHDHVMLLPITVTAANALLYSLRIPGQVIVDHQGTELEIDTLSPGFGGNHDGATGVFVAAEIVDQCGARICNAGARYTIRSLIAFHPFGVDAA